MLKHLVSLHYLVRIHYSPVYDNSSSHYQYILFYSSLRTIFMYLIYLKIVVQVGQFEMGWIIIYMQAIKWFDHYQLSGINMYLKAYKFVFFYQQYITFLTGSTGEYFLNSIRYFLLSLISTLDQPSFFYIIGKSDGQLFGLSVTYCLLYYKLQ